jgi:type II secretion system protein G
MRKEENIAVKAVRSGLTLVELLVVVAILGILGAIGVQQVTSHISNARKTAAKQGVNSIKTAMDSYLTKKRISAKKAPTDLEVLIKEDGDEAALLDGGEGALYDPWDNKYVLEHKKGDAFVIISFGPDGEKGTEDDIRSDEIKRKNN